MEFKPLSIEPTAVAQLSSNEVQEALFVHHDLDAVVFKRLVVVVHDVVEVELIHQPAAPAAFDAHAYKASFRSPLFREQALDLFASIVVHFDHGVWKNCRKNTLFRGGKGTLFGFIPNKLAALNLRATLHLWGMPRARNSKPRRSRAQLTTQFTTVVGMTLTLFMIGLIGLAGLLRNWAYVQVHEQAEIQVFLQRGLPNDQTLFAEKALAADPSVLSVKHISPDEGADLMEARLGFNPKNDPILESNPLSSAFIVTVKPDYSNVDSITAVMNRFDNIQGVDKADGHLNELSKVQSKIDSFEPKLWAAAGVCFLIALALLNNTIRLTVFSRRFLIRNMQLVGARPRLVRRPFVLQGLLLGASSGLLAFAGILALLTWFQHTIPQFSTSDMAIMASGLVGAGGLLGAGFTVFAVNRYLRADLSQLH